MKYLKLLIFCFILFCLNSCHRQKSRKKISQNQQEFISKLQTFIGVPYKYGGNDYNGIDCSGLVCKVFLQQYELKLPRQTWQQASFFPEITLKEITIGDLVFFVTSGTTINHVGIVSDVSSEIFFIHASTSKGVREDYLNNSYWKSRFVKATRPILK